MKNLIYLLLLIFVSACGPNAEEKTALQKAHDDSLKLVAEESMKQKINEKTTLQNSVLEFQAQKEGAENRLMVLKANLETAEDQMRRIKEPQFLRTPAERDQQITGQSLKISTLEKEIQETQNRYEKIVSQLEKTKSQLADIKQSLNEPAEEELTMEEMARQKAIEDSIAVTKVKF